MTEPHDCPAMQSLLAELATGAAAGHDRAWALGHVAGCPTCRTELAELARVADGLLMLAPPAKPPTEFESAVLARLDAAPCPARRRRSGALRRLAGGRRPPPGQDPGRRPAGPGRRHPRRVILAVVAAGEQAGTVFLYQGNPSWLLVTVTSAPTDGRYEIHVLDRGGVARTVDSCQLDNRAGTAGYRLDIPVSRRRPGAAAPGQPDSSHRDATGVRRLATQSP